jgi:hypothetical protein
LKGLKILFNNAGFTKLRLGIKFKALWLAGNILWGSKNIKKIKIKREAIAIEGNSLISRFFQNVLKYDVFSSVKKITNPLIIKKKLTPRFPWLK